MERRISVASYEGDLRRDGMFRRVDGYPRRDGIFTGADGNLESRKKVYTGKCLRFKYPT